VDGTVACDASDSTIINISLHGATVVSGGNSSIGPILSGICSFVNLEHLVLAGTSLNETLPACIGQLGSLQELDLSNSKLLHGALPSLAGLKSLKRISVSGAAFTSLPEDVCELPTAALTNTTCAMAGNPLEDCTTNPLPMCVKPCGARCTTGKCIGSSSYLTNTECSVWGDLSSQPGWNVSGACTSTDPCALCRGANGTVTCTDDHTGTHISGLVFASQPVPFNNITIPLSVASLAYLSTLDFSGDQLGGLLPALPFKQYTGANSSVGGCNLGNNDFVCPLPDGAADCKPTVLNCTPTPPKPTPSPAGDMWACDAKTRKCRSSSTGKFKREMVCLAECKGL
jgi:hypothetical protein